MPFLAELSTATQSALGSAVQSGAGSLVQSGETYFQRQTGIALSQPLPPATDASLTVAPNGAEASDSALDAPRAAATPMPQWLWWVAGLALLGGAFYVMRKR